MKQLLVLLISLVLFALANNTTIDPIHNPSLWDTILKKYVRIDGEINGIPLHVVNYTGIKADPDFGTWIDAIVNLDSKLLDNLTQPEFYSFYSNAYNTYAVHMMIEHACKKDIFGSCGPITGIRDIGTIVPFKLVWNKYAGKIAGKSYSLQQIEDGLLSPPSPMKADPRVHSAIVCASVSCPNLRKGAFTPAGLDAQYNETFNDWMSNNKKGMHIDQDKKRVKLSEIFNWYKSMFVDYFSDGNGSVLRYIVTFLDKNNTNYTWLSQNYDTAKVEYFHYDWDANVDGKLPCSTKSRPCYQTWALLVTIGALLLVVLIVVVVVVCRRRRRARSSSYSRINTN